MRDKSWLLAALVAAALVLWMVSGYVVRGGERARTEPDVEEAPDAPVTTVQVREQRAEAVTRRLELQGQALPERVVTIRAEVTGRVRAVPVAKGGRVEAGTVIAELAQNDRQARLQEAQALVKQRQAEAEAARKLADSGYQSDTRVRAADAALEAARARLATIREEIDQTRITSAFAGVLDERHVEEGDYLAPGDPVGRIVDLDPLRIAVNVSQQDIDSVTEGVQAQARFATGEQREATVRYIASEATEQTRTFRVELEVANADVRIPAGVSVTVRIPIETVRAHFLSPALLALNDEGALGVKTVAGDGRVAFHPVEVVRAELDGVWVTGLPEAVRLITVGHGFVRHGEPVKAVTAGESPLDLNGHAGRDALALERG